MICASSFARPQNERRDHSWLSLVILRKMVGRANSNDLEIPGGEEFLKGEPLEQRSAIEMTEVDKYPC